MIVAALLSTIGSTCFIFCLFVCFFLGSSFFVIVVVLLGSFCPYTVSLALPVTGGGKAQCVIEFERSAALIFSAAGKNLGRKVRIAQWRGQGQPGT